MLMLYLQRFGWIPVVTMLIAFILTFCNRQTSIRLASIFYSIGTLGGIVFGAYMLGYLMWVNYHLTDGPPAGTGILVLGLRPEMASVIYAICCVTLLLPCIPQEKALRFGKILHLIVLPAAVLLMAVVRSFGNNGVGAVADVGWLIYPFLWFRIRENYEQASPASSGSEDSVAR